MTKISELAGVHKSQPSSHICFQNVSMRSPRKDYSRSDLAWRLCDSISGSLSNNSKLLETPFHAWKHLSWNRFYLSLNEKVHDSKPDRAALVGELKKVLPIISGNLNNFTFNFNFWLVHFTSVRVCINRNGFFDVLLYCWILVWLHVYYSYRVCFTILR